MMTDVLMIIKESRYLNPNPSPNPNPNPKGPTPHPFPSSSSHLTNLPSKPSPPPPPKNIIASTTAALTSLTNAEKKPPTLDCCTNPITVIANLSLPHSFQTPLSQAHFHQTKEIPISDLLNLPPLYNPLGGKTGERERERERGKRDDGDIDRCVGGGRE